MLFSNGRNKEAGCWCHGRRHFYEAFRAGEGEEPARVLQIIQRLFRIEREIAALSPAERLEVRHSQSAPLVSQLMEQAKVRRHELGPESISRKGFVYLDNQRDALSRFLEQGEIPIHNNASERALRRVVKGRMNWLFHGSDEHAESAAALISLVASAELHNLDPELYLQEILTVIGEYPSRNVIDLAPQHWVQTRRSLIEGGQLRYIDLAQVSGLRLGFRGG